MYFFYVIKLVYKKEKKIAIDFYITCYQLTFNLRTPDGNQ